MRKNKHVPRLGHNVTLATMRLNNSTFISQNYDKRNSGKQSTKIKHIAA